MRRRALLIAAPFALAALAPATGFAQPTPAELRWTRIPAAELERYEAAIGGVRMNNLAVDIESGTDPAGPATAHEFSVSVANRGADWRHVLVQLVGARADGTPTLSALAEADVEPRRNESLRVRFHAAEDEMKQTAVFHLRVLTLPRD